MSDNISVVTTNPALFGETTQTLGGPVTFDDQGRANVSPEIATELLAGGGFTAGSDEDAAQAADFKRRSVPTAQGPYDPGDQVRIFLPDLAGDTTKASDGQTVKFDLGGYATCGRKTAEQLRMAHASLVIEDDAAAASSSGQIPGQVPGQGQIPSADGPTPAQVTPELVPPKVEIDTRRGAETEPGHTVGGDIEAVKDVTSPEQVGEQPGGATIGAPSEETTPSASKLDNVQLPGVRAAIDRADEQSERSRAVSQREEERAKEDAKPSLTPRRRH